MIRIRDERGTAKYMVTNGGSGIGAFVARAADAIKDSWRRARLGTALQALGSRVYQLPVVGEVCKWDFRNWRLEVTLPGQKLKSTAPIVLVSNQPRLGRHFLTAPFTRNDDGRFNPLLVEAANHRELIRSIVDLRLGIPPAAHRSRQNEVASLVIESTSEGKGARLAFFGDGEILFDGARRLEIDCVPRGIRILAP